MLFQTTGHVLRDMQNPACNVPNLQKQPEGFEHRVQGSQESLLTSVPRPFLSLSCLLLLNTKISKFEYRALGVVDFVVSLLAFYTGYPSLKV